MNAITKFRKVGPGGGAANPALSGGSSGYKPELQMGHYVTKDQRQTVALEVKRSHFLLGNDKGKHPFGL
jgi:hypothetical protein